MVCALVVVAGCGAADNRVDPGDLGLRDLLGVSPEVAAGWDAAQRTAARRVLVAGLDDDAATAHTALAPGRARGERIARTLAVLDGERADAGAGALGLVRVAVAGAELAATGRPAIATASAAAGGDAPVVELWLGDGWDAPAWGHLPGRGLDVLAALAVDAGHDGGPVVVSPGPRLAVIAAYVDGDAGGRPELVVNPVLLAALDPDPLEATTAAALGRAVGGGDAPGRAGLAARAGEGGAPIGGPATPQVMGATGGNPYSFYGSVAECAYAQRTRCEACLPGNTCAPVTDITDGNAECTMLGAAGGRGYFLLCINLALSISSVDRCAEDEAPSCPRDTDAASSLAELEQNARFLDDPACAAGLDLCLADIYGETSGSFPGTDGGVASQPPRETNVACGDACESNNCEASPSCNATGPSCNNSLSCDSTCSSSNEQSGCAGNCEACDSSGDPGGGSGGGCGGCDSEGSTGGGGGGCGGDDGGGSNGCGSCSSDSGDGGCGSSDSGGGSGGGCGGDGGGSCGGDGGGGCGGDGGSCSGGGGGGGCSGGGGGGGSSCTVARRGPPASLTLMIAGMWALLPIPAAALVRRRARRKARSEATPPDDAGGAEEVAS